MILLDRKERKRCYSDLSRVSPGSRDSRVIDDSSSSAGIAAVVAGCSGSVLFSGTSDWGVSVTFSGGFAGGGVGIVGDDGVGALVFRMIINESMDAAAAANAMTNVAASSCIEAM